MAVPGQVRAAVPESVLKHRYRLDDRIAVGGMGEVWRCTDLALGREVAIKLLRPEYAQDEECLARFRAEGRHTASLSHPNIAQVYDYFEMAPPEPGFLVLELVEGQSLARVLDAGPLDPGRAMGIIAQAATGLEAAHAAGVVHRDIKPGNLLISRDGQVKITDFGVAQVAGAARLTRTGALVGTPAYLAPERAAGGLATPAGDLYALGIVAHHCLTGQVPFDGEPLVVALAHMQREMPPLPPSVPAGVAALVAELTAKDPAARPRSAKDVAIRAGQLRAAQDLPLRAQQPQAAQPAAFPAGQLPSAQDVPVPSGQLRSAPDVAVPAEPPRAVPSRPPGGGARRRWRRLPRAGISVGAALVIAGLVLAGLGWALAAHGPGPPHVRSPGTHPAFQQANRPGAGPRPVASAGPGSTGDASDAGSRSRRHGRSSRPSSKPSAPSPSPSAPSPGSSASPPAPTPSPTCIINLLGIKIC
jgi:eukaryotic-like serine/threonine-protein kinase